MNDGEVREYIEILDSAMCVCGKPWEKWCVGCNLVYCAEHVGRDKHECKDLDKRGSVLPR
jgi:hypothetical protein